MSDKGKSMWLGFFRTAGIPAGFDTKYALIFDENRIKMDMLMDINKECLRDMGITAMGDIIAILKHAKQVDEESKAQAYDVPQPTSTIRKLSPPGEVNTSPSSGSSSSSASGPRSVIINTKIIREQNPDKYALTRCIAAKTAIAKRITSVKTGNDIQDCDSTAEGGIKKPTVVRLKRSVSPAQREEVPVQKKTRVLPEQEGSYKIKMPLGIVPKTQKFLQDRLGPTFSSTTPLMEKKFSVFDRLGGDGKVSSSSEISRSPSTSSTKSEDQKTTSVFARLGQGKPVREELREGGVDLLKTMKFEVKNTAPVIGNSVRPKPNLDVFRERTLTTIHSKIHRPLETSRNSSYDRSDSSISSSESKMRSSIEKKESSVKSRLGSRRSMSRSRSRSLSPPLRRSLQSRDSSRDSLRISASSSSQRPDLAAIRQQRMTAPLRRTSPTGVVRTAPRKINSNAVVNTRASIPVGAKPGQVLKEEKYVNAEGKLMIRRTIIKKVGLQSKRHKFLILDILNNNQREREMLLNFF